MSKNTIIRAWSDPVYRQSLSLAELSAMPSNPAGLVELTETEMDALGGARWNSATTACPNLSYCAFTCTSATVVCTFAC